MPEDSSFDAMLERTDAAMYQAKRQGRNQIVVAGPMQQVLLAAD